MLDSLILVWRRYKEDTSKLEDTSVSYALESPRLCYLLGIKSGKDFENNKVAILQTLNSSPMWSYKAGKTWSNKIFDDHIIPVVASDPEYSYRAGKTWITTRFENYKTELVSSVATDSDWSLRAGKNWSKKRLKEATLKKIAEGVCLNKRKIVDAGINWSDSIIGPCLENFSQVLKNSREEKLAKEYWKKDRLIYLIS